MDYCAQDNPDEYKYSGNQSQTFIESHIGLLSFCLCEAGTEQKIHDGGTIT